MLAAREFKPRYRQAILGVAWVLLQPLATAMIFAIVFGRFAHLPSDGVPYLLFAFAGFIPWTFFSSTVSRATHALTGNQPLVTKVYLPRVLLPSSSMLLGYVDVLISLAMVLALLPLYKLSAGAQLLLLPAFLLLLTVTTLGFSLALSALNAQYRDVSYAVPVILQLWMFATPVVYSSSLVPERWHFLLAINPLVVCAEGFRYALFGRSAIDTPIVVGGVSTALLALVAGMVIFKRVERHLADRI